MSADRPTRGFTFGIDTQLLVTDSVVLRESDVADVINAFEDKPDKGDVLDGLRYGIYLSGLLWAAILVGGLLMIL